MRYTTKTIITLVASVLLTCSNAAAQVNTQRGATVGGLAGAAIGTAIGDNNGKAGAGAAIGGVVGALAGGLLGNAKDKEAAIAQQRRSYHYQQQQIAQMQSAVTLSDVISMSRSGLSDSVIINQIQTRGVIQKVAVPDIIALHQQGVSEHVITTLQTAGTRPQQVARAPVIVEQPVIHERVITPAPVIVRERHVVPYYRRPSYHHHHHRRISHGATLHFGF